MTEEKKILENYYQRNATGFEFADKEQFGDVATYFGVSRIYIDRLEQQLSQLQQDNENLRTTIKNDDIATNNLCNEIRQLKADYGNKAQVERDILLQQKEELIKCCESEVEELDFENNFTKEQIMFYIAGMNDYRERIISKLKESKV